MHREVRHRLERPQLRQAIHIHGAPLVFAGYGISGFQAHITHTTDMLASGLTSFYGGALTEPQEGPS